MERFNQREIALNIFVKLFFMGLKKVLYLDLNVEREFG